MFQPTPGQYVGDKPFTAMLAEVKCPMPLYEVKSFLLGCLSATEMPKLDSILSTPWGGTPPAFDSQEQMQEFVGQLFALWNQMAAGQAFQLSAAPAVTTPAQLQAYTTRRQGEVVAFLRGLDAGKTGPQRLSAPARRALDALGTAHHLWSEFDRLTGERPEEAAASLRETTENLTKMDKIVTDAIAVVVEEQRRSRMEQMRGGGAQATTAAPGRNDPCPCGSGHKYKRCCGAH